MGSTTFFTAATGYSLAQAFHDAATEAAFESGSGGYTGTIAEKSNAILVTDRVMWRDDAEREANRLIGIDDPRIRDKWGPAGAIAYCSPKRVVKVTVDTHGIDPSLYKDLAIAQVKLAKGEKIDRVQSAGLAVSRTDSKALFEVIIERAGQGSTTKKTLTVKVDGSSNDHDFKSRVRAAALAKTRLGAASQVVDVRIMDSTAATKTTVTKGVGKVTRYVVRGKNWQSKTDHNRFETGFASLSEATRYAKSLTDEGTFEIEAITRSANGEGLASVTKTAVSTSVTVELTIVTGRTAPRETDGWLFFGWASC